MYSVVIPVYQAKESLKRCVDSWLGQTLTDLELILVDDGSTDGSKALCDELAERDDRIRVIHQPNSGVSAARNAGIREARGEFVLFTDSDDYVLSDYLERMSALQRKENSDLVLCGFHHLFDGADIPKLPGQTRTVEIQDFSGDFLELYEKSYLNMPWNKLFRRERMGAFDTSLSLGEDLLFNLEYLRKCRRISVLAEPLCCYIQDVGRVTLSSEKRENRLTLARRVCEETERFYREMWGEAHREGRIFTRYVSEILDECEKLPGEDSMNTKEKISMIERYGADPWLEERGSEAALTLLDYRILWYFLKRKRAGSVYLLCVIRWLIVVFIHRMRRWRQR